jgi:hypothetical protein
MMDSLNMHYDRLGLLKYFNFTITAKELKDYFLGHEIVLINAHMGIITKRTQVEVNKYKIEGEGIFMSLKGVQFKGKYNCYDDADNLKHDSKEIDDVGEILNDLTDKISGLGIKFYGLAPYLKTGITPYNCDITGNAYDIITHIAEASSGKVFIDKDKFIYFSKGYLDQGSGI